MLVNAKDMLNKAKAEGYAVGAFNINNLEWTKAILTAAQESASPVILGVSEGAGKYMTGYKTVAAMVKAMVEEMGITVPVALHLDHGSYEGTKRCIEAGFTSVMFDGSHYPIEENVAKTAELVELAHSLGISIEAEVGSIGGEEDGVAGRGEVADAQQCKMIADLGIDMLAAGIGNIHGKYLTLKECLEENKEHHENTVFYVTDETEQSQYINMFKEAGIDAVILTHNIDQPFITHLESKNENVKFARIDADLSDSFKEETNEDELKEISEKLTETFKSALKKDNLNVKVEKLKNASISAMITLSEQDRRMQDMMKMYNMYGMVDPSMFGQNGQTLVLNANNELVKYISEHSDGENTALFCEQLYDLALLSHAPLTPEQMTNFIARSNKIMELLAK